MIERKRNIIYFTGDLHPQDLKTILSLLHLATTKKGYQDLVLDFTTCAVAFQNVLVPLCMQIRRYRHDGIETSLILPKKDKLKRLFLNSNWAYLLDPLSHSRSTFSPKRQLPATPFLDSDEQIDAVDRAIEVVLESTTGISRDGLAALEWALTEITDNVISHSKSETGGLIQLTSFYGKRKKVEFVICDAGIGIPASIRQNDPTVKSEPDAIRRAIKEGFTTKDGAHQGNGLFGSHQVCMHSEGIFEIQSGHGRLSAKGKKLSELVVTHERVPYVGTSVSARIFIDDAKLLDKALRFGGRACRPVDYIELKYEHREIDQYIVKLIEHKSNLGNRPSAALLRTKILNLCAFDDMERIVIDFTGIPIISSSVADEIVGKVYTNVGDEKFQSLFRFVGLNENIKGLIDRAIILRKKQPDLSRSQNSEIPRPPVSSH